MVLLFALLATPAQAQDPPACRITGGPYDADPQYGRMGQLAQPVAADAEAWLGEQWGTFWTQGRDGNWYVGVAPGPGSVESARAGILERVEARYDGEDAALLRDRLRVVEQPYGYPELRRIQGELANQSEGRWAVGRSMAWAACARTPTASSGTSTPTPRPR